MALLRPSRLIYTPNSPQPALLQLQVPPLYTVLLHTVGHPSTTFDAKHFQNSYYAQAGPPTHVGSDYSAQTRDMHWEHNSLVGSYDIALEHVPEFDVPPYASQ